MVFSEEIKDTKSLNPIISDLKLKPHLPDANESINYSGIGESVVTSDAYWNNLLFVNTKSGNGLLPDSIKSLPEPMLTNCSNTLRIS